jgi:hypothetical protein
MGNHEVVDDFPGISKQVLHGVLLDITEVSNIYPIRKEDRLHEAVPQQGE